MCDHFSQSLVSKALARLRRLRLIPGDLGGRATLPLLCLAPRGVCRAPSVTLGAVGSYPTLSPLPVSLRTIGGLLSAALSVRRPLKTGVPRFHGARCPVVSGLSSTPPKRNRDRPGSGGRRSYHQFPIFNTQYSFRPPTPWSKITGPPRAPNPCWPQPNERNRPGFRTPPGGRCRPPVAGSGPHHGCLPRRTSRTARPRP